MYKYIYEYIYTHIYISTLTFSQLIMKTGCDIELSCDTFFFSLLLFSCLHVPPPLPLPYPSLPPTLHPTPFGNPHTKLQVYFHQKRNTSLLGSLRSGHGIPFLRGQVTFAVGDPSFYLKVKWTEADML